jgi:hypothetical protein
MCLERLGKLEIPEGLAGAAGPAGANGAGWASGSGDPVGTPAADVLFWLNTTSGELFKWNSSTLAWDPIVNSIFGTDGSQWITGTGVPTSNAYPAGTLYLDVGPSLTKGNIYEYDGSSWGSSIANIQGQNGTNGTNGLDAGTVPYRSWNNTNIPIGTGFTTLFYGGIEGGLYELCANIGDSFRINFYANAFVVGQGSAGNALDLQFSLKTASTSDVLLEPTLYAPPFDGPFYNVAPYNIPIPSYGTLAPAPEVIYVSANIFVQRVTITTFFYQFQWSATNINRTGGALSNVYSGIETFTFGSLPANYKEFRVTARRVSAASTVRASVVGVTIENLNLV